MGSTPKPICPVENPVCVDSGTLSRHRTPAPGARGKSPGANLFPGQKNLAVLLFDQFALFRFFRSVAHAKASERHLRLRWKTDDADDDKEPKSVTLRVSEKFVKGLYTVMWWKEPPGTVELDLGDQRTIQQETERDTEHLYGVFLDKAAQSPAAAIQFLKAQDEIRDFCLQGIQSLFQEAAGMNREIAGQADSFVKGLKVVRSAGTLCASALALPAVGASALVGGALSTGFGVTYMLIKEFDKAPGAAVVGVVEEGAKEYGKDQAEKGGEFMAETYQQEMEEYEKQAGKFEKMAAGEQAELAKKLTKKQMKRESALKAREYAAAKAAQYSQKAATAAEGASKAKWGMRAFKAVPYILFVSDVVEQGKEMKETFLGPGELKSSEAE